MQEIIKKFWRWWKENATSQIISIRKEKSYCIVNYLHGANITARRLFDEDSKIWTKYYQTLTQSDILFPDWISVQIFNFIHNLKFGKNIEWLESINWTDFINILLEEISKDYNPKLILYWTHSDIIKNSAKKFEDMWYTVIYYQDWYSDFDWESMENNITKYKSSKETIENEKKDIYIFIQWRTTIDNPIQEFWTIENIEKIKKHNFIVMNQSWTFDHSDFGGKETRSPEIFIKFKLERLRRTMINPKKWLPKIRANIKLIPLTIQKIILSK